jgi:RNA polymerase sigma factor (sigma-70 family)
MKRGGNVPALRLVKSEHDASADAAALARVASGEVDALGEVFDRHARALLAFAERAAGRRDADDVVQMTFVRAMRLAPRFDSTSETARPWLFGIAARVILEQRRAFARFARALVRFTSSEPERAEVDTSSSDIERVLARLSAPKRVVVVLAEIEGYSCDEIASQLEIPVGTVWTRLHHARKELRALLLEERS